MKKIKSFLLLCLIAYQSCSFCSENISIVKDEFPLQIKNPSLSHQQKLKIKLPNNLEVLLISDYKANLSGAALIVHSGSWDNPNNHLGLAHLTEHCVFLGSKKYPGIAEFSNYLTKYNGTYNAFTHDKRTTYLFTVNNEGFLGALDLMSSFLHEPLFATQPINKEKNAVHEEFSRHQFNDNWRIARLEQIISNPAHPNHLFSMGNLSSLQLTSSEDMKAWFKKHYFSGNMSLIVISPLPLHVLTEKVEEYFGSIPDGIRNDDDFPSLTSEPMFDSSSTNKLFVVKSSVNRSELELLWSLPEEYSQDLSSMKQIAFLLEHGVKNGLKNRLTEQLLISDLQVEMYNHKKHVAFSILINLTDKGNEKYLDVLNECFNYLHFLEKENIPKYIFEEINKKNTLEYEFQDNQNLFKSIQKWTHDLADDDLALYPSRKYLLKTYDPKENKKLLTYLANPENCRFFFLTTSQEKYDANIENNYDPVFDFMYQVYPLEIKSDMTRSFNLPQSNPFLSNSIHDIPIETQKNKYPFRPIQVSKSNAFSIFYTPNTDFPSPQTAWTVLISFPKKNSSAKNFVLIDIFRILANNLLSDLKSYAQNALLDFSINPNANGIDISIIGFYEQAPMLLQTILNKLLEFTCSQEQFISALDQIKDNYFIHKYYNPLLQGLDCLQEHILGNYISLKEKISASQETSWKDFQDFSEKIFKQIFVEAMLIGNLNKKILSSTTQIINNFSKNKKNYNVSNNQYLYLKNNFNEKTFVEESPFESNAFFFALCQDKLTAKETVSISILFQKLHTIFFEDLRTEQQVGYAVGATVDRISLDSLFGKFYIQSKQYSPKELSSKTQRFLQDFKNSLASSGLPSEEFLLQKQAFIKSIIHSDLSSEELSLQLFYLVFNPYNFHNNNSMDSLLEAAETLSYEEFIKCAVGFLDKKLSSSCDVFINATSK